MSKSALKLLDQKLIYLLLGASGLFLLILLRLLYLQLYRGPELARVSQRNFSRVCQVTSLRGNILDCHGQLIATNRPVRNLCWQGTGNKQLTAAQLAQLNQISQLTGLTFDLKLLTHAERRSKQLVLASDLPLSQLLKLEELCADDPQIQIETTFERHYPYGDLAAHVVGYLGAMNLEKSGRMGLEKIFEQELQGQRGQKLMKVNAVGKQVAQIELTQAVRGATLATTLDLALQQLAEMIFPADYRGCLIIMDPANGAIRALLSRPNFTPSMFLKPMPATTWQTLQSSKPFVNRALNATYPPASLFKLVSMTAALEGGLVQPETRYYCAGHMTFAGRKYHCHANKEGHGLVDMQGAIAQSCNIPFFEIARHLSIDRLAEYAQIYGLGQPTGILFPEQIGLVPTRAWKRQVKREPWWAGETLSAIIGQSYLLVTPMQMIRLVASIFQGYLVKPRLLESEVITQVPLQVHASTLKFLRAAMRQVALVGTARRLAEIPDLVIYAKTGTAQTKTIIDRAHHIEGSARHNCWFASYFQFQEQTPLVMVILVEYVPEGMQLATATAKEFFSKYRQLCRACPPLTPS